MLVGFIGCPSSGKTTSAALLFADLKMMSKAAEFVPEQARWYISEKRNLFGVPAGYTVALTDKDQEQIALKQIYAEQNLVHGCTAETYIITDASAICAGLYMSHPARKANYDMLASQAARYDVLFYAKPVKRPDVVDANRVHDEEFSLEIDRQIPDFLGKYGIEAVELSGIPDARRKTALKKVLAVFKEKYW